MFLLAAATDLGWAIFWMNKAVVQPSHYQGMFLLCSGPSPEGTQSKKPSLASRLSQRFQAFRKAAPEEDDDFQPDRKRLRTPEQQVLSDAF